MKKLLAITAALALLGLGIAAQADVFNLGTGVDGFIYTNLETVTVGNVGNVGDPRYTDAYDPWGHAPASYGSVGYIYNIGKYEVTAKQYTDFLNKVAATDTYGLYYSSMASATYGCQIQRGGADGNYTYSVADDYANRPVNYVSWADAARFANWLHNGQPTGPQGPGTTETGAYTMGDYNGIDNRAVQRNLGAKWTLASEDEWYKTAYYDPNRGGTGIGGYWDYPTKSNTPPANQVLSADPGNSANYWVSSYSIGGPYYRTNAGEFENSGSAYGTFDQGGNVWEWNDTTVYLRPGVTFRGLRGGAFGYGASSMKVQANYGGLYDPTVKNQHIGFRVSGVVPAYGISNRAAYDPIISAASSRFNFKVWGEVTILVSGNSFSVDDGSGAPVRVVAPGFSGIEDGDYACVSGGFSGEGSNRVLNAKASDIVKLP